jgi:hypothetical protein
VNRFNLFIWLRSSLDNSKDGASGKKMAAFWVIMFLVTPLEATWAIWAYRKDDWSLLPDINNANYFFAAVALGINGAEKIIDKFSKKTPSNENINNTEPSAESAK